MDALAITLRDDRQQVCVEATSATFRLEIRLVNHITRTEAANLRPPSRLRPCATRSESAGRRDRTPNRQMSPVTTGSAYASFPSLVESRTVDTIGASTWAKAGLGL